MNSLFLCILVHLFFLARVHPFPDETHDDIDHTHPFHYSVLQVGAEFTTHYGDGGVIQVLMDNKSDSSNPVAYPVCYPETFRQHLEAVKLVHVLCKQMGYVTFGTRYKEVYPEAQVGVLSTSATCTGLEDRVSNCPWNSVQIQQCEEVLATKCTTCNDKISASNGSIHNPGFPHTYLYSIGCEWTLEVPENLGIELVFAYFSLPREGEHKCESHVELSYGNQKLQRFCPTDLVEKVSVPVRSVRLRFSAGTFWKNHAKPAVHYGFHILFKATKLETPNTLPIKIIIISSSFLLFVIMCVCCYCLRNIGSKVSRVPRVLPAQPNAPTEDQIQSAFEFQRCAMMVPESERNSMEFSIYQSENSSTDSSVARWRTQSNLPVTSALAPLGPESRKVSIATTPRSVFADTRREWSQESAMRIAQLRTKLVARFSSSSAPNRSDISVFLSASDRNSYSKLSCEEDIPLTSIGNFKESSSADQPNSPNVPKIPSIVIDFVK